MQVLPDRVQTSSDVFQKNYDQMRMSLDELAEVREATLRGGGEKAVARLRARGKMLVRERIEWLLDEDSAFLELMSFAAWGTEFTVGASVVTGIGVIEGVEIMLIAHDPTVRGGTLNPFSFKKVFRAMEIAKENRLPVMTLVESGGADLPTQAEVAIPGGRMFRDLTDHSSAGLPTIALVFGNATAGGAYMPGMSDYVVMVRERAKVFLGGPPLVKMATGETADDESLGGAEMHARTSGLADYLAEDELDALRIGREIVRRLNWRRLGSGPSEPPDEPLFPADQLLGIPSSDPKVPFDPRDVLARIVDGSRFDEFKPLYGTSLVTGWASVHGYPLGVLANARGVLFNEEAEKAAQFIQLANQIDTPLLFLQNTTGYMVGQTYEQAGIIKDGAKMINAVTNSRVPHLTINMGVSYGAGNYGMAGRAFGPRFLFSWANSKTAVMGPQQLAGVMSIVARESAADRGLPFDEAADATMRERVQSQIEREQTALAISSRVYDDGVIDPRDTRSVLGICLSVIHNAEVRGQRGYGVFRM